MFENVKLEYLHVSLFVCFTGEIFKDMLEVFDKDMFHMGGDEVFFQCWYYNEQIRRWQEETDSYDLMDLWGHFQDKGIHSL